MPLIRDSDKMLQRATERIPGQAMSPEARERAQKIISENIGAEDIQEAARFTEEIVAWLGAEWAARGFTKEQGVFSLALATINFREHLPEDQGGKELFDRAAHEAHVYFRKNTDTK